MIISYLFIGRLSLNAIKNSNFTALTKKKKPAKKQAKSMDELTKSFDEFMKGKKVNPKALEDFNNILKKAFKQK